MSECIDLPDFDLPDLPIGLEIPTIPTISFGEVNACCIVLVPKLNIDFLPPIPGSIQIPMTTVMEAKMKLLETYFRIKDMIPQCPLDG